MLFAPFAAVGGAYATGAATVAGAGEALLPGSAYAYVQATSLLQSMGAALGTGGAKIIGVVLGTGGTVLGAVVTGGQGPGLQGDQLEEYLEELPGAQTTVESITGTADFRRLDALEPWGVVEAKNVIYQALTRQLTDAILYAQSLGINFYLLTNQATVLSGPLKDLVDRGIVIWFRWGPW
jgi:Restriction endonuclease fold toxin 7